jgi:hypothetical protein
MARHTMVTIPMVMITMYVSWKADIVAAQYDMDSVWNMKQISQQPNEKWTTSGTQKISHHANIKWKVSGTQNRYHTNPMSHGQVQ